MIVIQDLSYQLGDRLLFADVTLNLAKGQRYGIVGANGCGKSTLLRLIAGEYEQGDGQIIQSKDSTIGWLKQDHYLYEDSQIIDVVLRGHKELWDLIEKKHSLLESEEWTDEVGMEVAKLEDRISHAGGYAAEAEAEKLLVGLGISEKLHRQPLSVLSGGYKLRCLLAQVLFSEPDILLLDEPTNYLDIVTINWLERCLKQDFSGLLLFVSHDFQFLNNLSTTILDIDYAEIRSYPGNYSNFLKKKKEVAENIESEKEHIEKRIAELQRFIERFRGKPSKAAQCRSREKMIARLTLPDEKQSSRIAPNFKFNKKRPSGRIALKVDQISKAFDKNVVLFDVSFEVEKGDKVAIIGPNGVGKSTLLRILMDEHKPDDGNYTWGHEAHVSYFPQEHSDMKRGEETLFDWVKYSTGVLQQNVQNALGSMLFSLDDTAKPLNVLSGGELARGIFAKMMLERGNVLILDEPTNHLDIESREALGQALAKYDGTVLIVSHDREFISDFATRILSISHDEVSDYPGSYKEYIMDQAKGFAR